MDSKFNVKRWMRYSAIALLSGVMASVLVADTDVPFKPGLWEFTSTADSGLTQGGTSVDTQCITDDLMDIDKMTSELEKSLPGAKCDVKRSSNGNIFEVSMVCSGGGGNMEGQGSYTVGDGGLSMEGEMTIKLEFAGNPLEVKTVATGKWVGEC